MPRGVPNRSAEAKHNPVLSSGGLETAEQAIGHTQRTGDADAHSPEDRIGEPSLIQVADRFEKDPEHAAMLAFMEEPVTIRPTRTTEKNEQVFEITINGRAEVFRVNQEKTVKRYYVDHLARMKTTGYTDVETTNAEGIKQILHTPHTVLKYDFAMVRDANPLGESWLKATLAQGG